jgi:superfamily I DNA/RNA helicase
MAANPRTVVRGSAGTGKSVIALERALQLSSSGLKVLYLCYNQLLAAHVRAGVAADKRAACLDIRHVHALYRERIERSGLLHRLQAEDENQTDFFSRRFPELAAEALCETTNDGWDVLVVDEAQDLLTPEHLDAFDLMLRGGLSQGRWHLFFDPQQNLYGSDVQAEVEGRLAIGAPAFDDLFENCRNTRQVAVQTSIISGIDLAITGAPNGLPCDNVYYATTEEGIASLNSTVRRLLTSDVRCSDIAVLSTRRRENSLLAGVRDIAGHQLAEPNDESALRRGALLVTTMHAFKGLERQVVIALDMAELGQPFWAMLHYAGLSRARCLLHVFLPQTVRKAYERQAEAFGRRLLTRAP